MWFILLQDGGSLGNCFCNSVFILLPPSI